MNNVNHAGLERSKRNLEIYLESRIPGFKEMNTQQAMDVMSMAVFRVWTAWAILVGRVS